MNPKGFAWITLLIVLGLLVAGSLVGYGIYVEQGTQQPTQEPLYQPVATPQASTQQQPSTAQSTTQTSGQTEPSAAIDKSLLITNSSAPTITGTAKNISSVYVAVLWQKPGTGQGAGDTMEGFAAQVPVVNGRWSLSASSDTSISDYPYAVPPVPPGTYTVYINTNDGRQATQPVLLATGTLMVTNSSSFPGMSQPSISITNISGRTVTVRYANLTQTKEGTTSPSSLWVQNTGYSKPLLQVDLNGESSGTTSFTVPTDAPDGSYTATPVGIPTQPYVGGVGPGWVSFGVYSTLTVSNGSVSIGQ